MVTLTSGGDAQKQLNDINDLIESAVGERDEEIVVHLSTSDGRTRAWLYRNARIVNEKEDEEGLRIVARVSPKTAGRLRRMLEPQ